MADREVAASTLLVGMHMASWPTSWPMASHASHASHEASLSLAGNTMDITLQDSWQQHGCGLATHPSHGGKDVSIENLHQGFTHVFESTFESVEGIAEYLAHPAHVEFANILLPVLEKSLVVDYKPEPVQL